MEKNSEMHVDRWVDDRLAALKTSGEWQPNSREGIVRLRERRGAVDGRRRRWILTAATATAACLIAAALPATRVFAQRCVGACSEAGIRIWESFSKSGKSAPGEELIGISTIAPDFTLSDAAGKTVKLSDFKGKVVLLNFWATWCPPCRVEIPWFMEFQKVYGDRDFVVLGISLDADGWKSVKPFVDEQNVTYRMMIGNDDITALYGGVKSLPATLIIDRSGRIASSHAGLASKDAYRAEIEALLR